MPLIPCPECGVAISPQASTCPHCGREQSPLPGAGSLERTLLDSMPSSVIVTDTDGRIVMVNERTKDLFGYDGQELLGTPIERLIPEPLREKHAWHRTGYQARPEFREMNPGGELRALRRDGREFPVRINLGPVTTSGGPLVVAVITDRTEGDAVEEQLRHLQRLDTLGQVTGTVAHDFNNLLTVIQADAELAADLIGSENQHAAALLRDLLASVRRGSELVSELMTFARRRELKLEPVDVGRVVEGLAVTLDRLLPGNITVRVRTGAEELLARADAGAIEQILLNLATNARDAMPEGGTLSIRCGRDHLSPDDRDINVWVRTGDFITILVGDTGGGMTREAQNRIFEPFYTTKPPGQGTGLGMAAVYGLMKSHGGMVHLYSEVGQGTTVKLYFPVAASGTVAGDALTEPAARPEIPRGRELILVVEDNDALRRATRRTLEKLGYSVVEARDGEAGLEAYRKHAAGIELVLTDLAMPRLDGLAVIQALRRAGAQVPLLVTSGHSGTDLEEAIPDDLRVAFLQKPWTVEAMARNVREVLDGVEMRDVG